MPRPLLRSRSHRNEPGSTAALARATSQRRPRRELATGQTCGHAAPVGRGDRLHHPGIGRQLAGAVDLVRWPAAVEPDLVQARHSAVDGIGALSTGTFYAAGEGSGFRKIQAPICLTHHAGPLTEEEIVERARRGGRQ